MRLSGPVAALLGACLIAAPALAAPAGAIKDIPTPASFGDSAPVIKVQRGQAGSNPGVSGPNRHSGGGQWRGGGGYRGGHDGGGDDGAVAAGVIGGLLLGAIIANEAQRGNAVEDCARRYRSYDRRSRTFIGRDGGRYSCP